MWAIDYTDFNYNISDHIEKSNRSFENSASTKTVILQENGINLDLIPARKNEKSGDIIISL